MRINVVPIERNKAMRELIDSGKETRAGVYDPNTKDFVFRGEAYNIGKLYDELDDLYWKCHTSLARTLKEMGPWDSKIARNTESGFS